MTLTLVALKETPADVLNFKFEIKEERPATPMRYQKMKNVFLWDSPFETLPNGSKFSTTSPNGVSYADVIWMTFNRIWPMTAQKKSSGKNHGLGGKSTSSACRFFATLRATKVAKITVIFRGKNTMSGSPVSSLSTGRSCTHILTRIEMVLRWQNVINVFICHTSFDYNIADNTLYSSIVLRSRVTYFSHRTCIRPGYQCMLQIRL
jgi:hypothetical protein